MRRAWLLLLLAAPALAQGRSPPAAHAAGVRFLVEKQNKDGTWGTFESKRTGEIWLGTQASHKAFRDATTALCIQALLVPARTDAAAKAAAERGLLYLCAAEPARRATGDTFYDTWTHTYEVEVLALALRDEAWKQHHPQLRRALEREVALLRERQSADGGWGYYDFGHAFKTPSGHESTSFLTGAALLALEEARAAGVDVPRAVTDGGVACLRALRLPDGAYVYGTYIRLAPRWWPNRLEGSLGRSQPCNLALFVLGKAGLAAREVDEAALKKGVEALKAKHVFLEIGRGRPYPHEAWYMTAGYYVLFGRHYAARALRAAGVSPQDELSRWLAQTTAKDQDRDGSWMDFPLYGYHQAYGTAFGLLTLQALQADGS